ncbi:hypothetical protein Ddye_005820 [Dipteronia dyeriana]|uniref:Uncharacterized protein n=1 Tax=Dipteronia dyeriana TaxID=168575 RepID=A0AAD9XH90_9ROSI|nr:hypothetical protein Ddye_005820 [Dipteronia dyeriana]
MATEEKEGAHQLCGSILLKKKRLMEWIMLFATTVRINSQQRVGMTPKVCMTILTDAVVENKKNIKTMLQTSKTTDGKVKVGTYSFDKEASRKELAHMIILHEYPLSMVEHLGFRRFMKIVQPLFMVASRNTIKNDILKIYDYERSKTMQLLERNGSRIAITTDK